MDVVIPSDGKSRWAALCVEAFYKHYKDCGYIWSVGKPIEGTINIAHKDSPQRPRQANVVRKIFAALEHVQSPFLLVHDDMVPLAPFSETPMYYDGNLLAPTRNGSYGKSFIQTGQWLLELDYPCLNFETHSPRQIEKDAFVHAMSLFKWETSNMQPMSIYGNTSDLPKAERADSKIRKLFKIKDAPDFISLPNAYSAKAETWVRERL